MRLLARGRARPQPRALRQAQPLRPRGRAARPDARGGGHRVRAARSRRLPREQEPALGRGVERRVHPVRHRRLPRGACASRGAAFTNASQVYADACAEHVLAMMLALSRQLLPSYAGQLGRPAVALPREARRIAPPDRPDGGHARVRLDRPAGWRRCWPRSAGGSMRSGARSAASPGSTSSRKADLTKVLAEADHVVDVLPENDGTTQLRERAADRLLQGPARGSTTWAAGPRWTRRR